MGARPDLKNEAGGGNGGRTVKMRLRSGSNTLFAVNPLLQACAEHLPDNVLERIHDQAEANYRAQRWPYASVAPELRMTPPNFKSEQEMVPVWFRGRRSLHYFGNVQMFNFTINGVCHIINVNTEFLFANEYRFVLMKDAPSIGEPRASYRYVIIAMGISMIGETLARICVTERRSPETQEAVYAMTMVMARLLNRRMIHGGMRIKFVPENGDYDEYTTWCLRRYLYDGRRKNWRKPEW